MTLYDARGRPRWFRPTLRLRLTLLNGVLLVGGALALVLFGLVAWQGWELAWASISVGEYAAGLVPFPLYPSKLALALGATLASAQALYGLVAGGDNNTPS